MERSDATHVSVGVALVGIGSVMVAILIPLAVAAKQHPWGTTWFLIPLAIAALLGLLGIYMVVAVYTGWRLPKTASERQSAADLRVQEVQIVQRVGAFLVFRVGFRNYGRGDVSNATVNVIVPDFASTFALCSEAGAPIKGGAISRTSESIWSDDAGNPIDSCYWANAGVSFAGRTSVVMHFLASVEDQPVLPVGYKVTSADLHDELHGVAVLQLTQQPPTALSSPEPEPEPIE